MEDALRVKLGLLTRYSRDFDFFGVYDGHGGSCVAHACRDQLHWRAVESKAMCSVVTVGSKTVVEEEEVMVATCSDLKVMLSRGDITISLFDDHKPGRPDELKRIESAGERVINWNGHRVLGVLATSRSVGNHYIKPFVILKPKVRVSRRTRTDEFLILPLMAYGTRF
ncbi:hypothetical protein ACSBR1_026526 [Camellia fascicularis]